MLQKFTPAWGTCLLLSICALASCTNAPTDDKAAIIALLEKESASWRARDAQAHAECWQIRPYSRILVSTSEGKCFDVPVDAVVHPQPDQMGDGGKSFNSNYRFAIYTDNAWVSHEEVSISPAGDSTFSHEIRMLEKVNGEWKMVGQSIHVE